LKIYYGFFNGQLYDFRRKSISEAMDPPFPLEEDLFSSKPRVFINWDGFLVFDRNVNIIDVFIAYFDELSSNGCCGRCFPGKFGTKILKEFLEQFKLDNSYNNLSEKIENAKSIAEDYEIKYAIEEGVEIKFLVAPTKILAKNDIVVVMELAEGLKALEFVKPGGMVILNRKKIYPLDLMAYPDQYPPEEEIIQLFKEVGAKIFWIEADRIAQEINLPLAENIIILGVIANFLSLDKSILLNLLEKNVPGSFLTKNLEAFEKGFQWAEEMK